MWRPTKKSNNDMKALAYDVKVATAAKEVKKTTQGEEGKLEKGNKEEEEEEKESYREEA